MEKNKGGEGWDLVEHDVGGGGYMCVCVRESDKHSFLIYHSAFFL